MSCDTKFNPFFSLSTMCCHNTLCLSPQILHKLCFQFPLGLTNAPKRIHKQCLWGTTKSIMVFFRNGLLRWNKVVVTIIIVKWYMKCFIYWSADLKSSKPCFERNLSNCEQKPEKVRTSRGFEPMTSRYRCDALTNWAMKPLGAGHLWVLMSPWGMDVKWYMKCFIYWTEDLKSSKPWSSQFWTQLIIFTIISTL